MLEQILKALTGTGQEDHDHGASGLRMATAALLVIAAQADDQFDRDERAVISGLLRERFRLSAAEVERLLTAAEQRADRALGIHRFIKDIIENSTPERRIWLIEMLWEVAYADGILTPDEDALIHRIGGLIHVADVDRGAARRRVLDRLALG